MFVKFVFYRESYAKSDAKSDAKNNVSSYYDLITKYLKENQDINSSKAAVILGLSKSRTNDILRMMVEDDILIKEGRSRATRYVVKR